MSKISSKHLQILIVVSVALGFSLIPANAQTEPSSLNPSGAQRDTNSSNCANGDLASCQLTEPSLPGQTTDGGFGGTGGYPTINPGLPTQPMSVYRDDAGMDHRAPLQQHRSSASKPQTL